MRYPKRQEKENRVQSWSSISIHTILNNRFYLGEMVYGKTIRKSVGSKGYITLPKEEWSTISGHHEPLITMQEFEVVSQKAPGHSTKRKIPKHPLVGKLYCGGCRYTMSYKPLTVLFKRGRTKKWSGYEGNSLVCIVKRIDTGSSRQFYKTNLCVQG